MNNQLITAVLIGVITIGGFVYYLNSKPVAHVDMMATSEEPAMMQGDMMMKEEGEMMKHDVVTEEKTTLSGEGMMADNMMAVEKKMMPTETPTTKTTDMVVAPAKTENAMKEKGAYVPFDAALFAKAQNGKVVIFFRASWCPTCKGLDANIRANLASIPDGVTILDLDYDNAAALKAKYGVTYQHTMVQVDKNGALIKKWSGSPTLAALVGEIK